MNPIANMEGLQAAIVNGEAKRVKQLLANQVLDELQKSYLIELAELNDKPQIVKLLQDAPAKP
ncbi:hypothetical protein J0A66_12455 [Bowmanella dokdonensis]|uniref:Uncharacterized protein n=2 Tax=Bowmanella dokdonensis TaxID=751969 RepID=A0A939DQE7_9ALTE|nr:hypothetical protein [Bowmanella dokdonensis]